MKRSSAFRDLEIFRLHLVSFCAVFEAPPCDVPSLQLRISVLKALCSVARSEFESLAGPADLVLRDTASLFLVLNVIRTRATPS
jgi:hypothetical protein